MLTTLTLSGFTTEIAAHLGKELDEPFKRILAQKIDSWRSRLLRNSLQEKPNEGKFFRQTIWIPLEKASPIPSCLSKNVPVCPVLRSLQPLPQPLRYQSSMFDFVGGVDGHRPFTQASAGTIESLMNGRYSSRRIFFDIVNNYLEIYGTSSLPMVRADGVMDRPYEAMLFNCAAGQGCDYWDERYPVTGDIAQMIVQGILQNDFARPETPANKEIQLNPQQQEHAPDGR